MVMLKYKGRHQPQDMLIDVEESKVKNILNSGNYDMLENKSIIITPVRKEQPNMSWKEKRIFDWIQVNHVPVKYSPNRDRKDDVLQKLKEAGAIDDDSK